MHRRVSLLPGMIGALALVAGGMTADVHAQRGGGAAAGQGRPDTAGTSGNASGRPTTARTPDQRPADGPTRPGSQTPRVSLTLLASQTPMPAIPIHGRPTIADQLNRDHGLAIQLAKLFPAGTNLADAAKDFENLGAVRGRRARREQQSRLHLRRAEGKDVRG